MSAGPRAATARLFVALDLPAGVREALAAWGEGRAAADPALRALPAGSLHLTLCFLGSRPVEEIAPIGAALAGCAGPAPRLVPGAAEWLPARRPRALAAAMSDRGGALAALHGRVVEALAAEGRQRPEHRPLRPHVTVARVRRGERPRVPRGEGPPPAGAFACEWLALYRSHLGAGPARYEALARVRLAAGRRDGSRSRQASGPGGT